MRSEVQVKAVKREVSLKMRSLISCCLMLYKILSQAFFKSLPSMSQNEYKKHPVYQT